MKTNKFFKNMPKGLVAFLFATALILGFTIFGGGSSRSDDGLVSYNASITDDEKAMEMGTLEKIYVKQHLIGTDATGQYFVTEKGIYEYLNGQDKIVGKTFKTFMDDLNGGKPIIDTKYIRKGVSYNISQDALGEGFLSSCSYSRTSHFLSPEYCQSKEARLALGNASELLNKCDRNFKMGSHIGNIALNSKMVKQK